VLFTVPRQSRFAVEGHEHLHGIEAGGTDQERRHAQVFGETPREGVVVCEAQRGSLPGDGEANDDEACAEAGCGIELAGADTVQAQRRRLRTACIPLEGCPRRCVVHIDRERRKHGGHGATPRSTASTAARSMQVRSSRSRSYAANHTMRHLDLMSAHPWSA
jgi:hypothetical protein